MPLTLPTTIATRALVPWGIDFEGGEIPPLEMRVGQECPTHR